MWRIKGECLDVLEKGGHIEVLHIIRNVLAALIFGFAFALTGEAIAQTTLLTNLPSNDGGGGGVTNEQQRAVTFTTLSSTFLVMEVQMRLVNYNTSTDVAELSLHLDASNKPGNQVGNTFTAPSSSSNSADNFSFTTDGIQLNAATTYWLVIKGSVASELFTWNRSDPTVTPSTTAFASFGDQWISHDTGSSWAVGSNGAHSFAIVGIPEPALASWVLGIAGIGLLVFRRSRRLRPQSQD